MAADQLPPDPPAGFVPVNPYALARNEAVAAQLKRFYAEASVAEGEGGFRVLLDGRPAKTPGRRDVVLPTATAAEMLKREWDGQGDIVRPGGMPAVRLVNTVIEGVAATMPDVRAEIVKFAGSDLLCYRAEAPRDLVDRQNAEWDPVLAWYRDQRQARFVLAEGIVHVTQPDMALIAVDRAITAGIGQGAAAPFRLGALHVMTTLTGSALLAVAVLAGVIDAADAWRKAHVDEDFQISRWGEDDDAAERRNNRWADMRAAADLLAALQ